jgi:hypothetical protein
MPMPLHDWQSTNVLRVKSAVLCNRRLPVNFRYALLATELVSRCNMSRRAMFGRLRVGKENLHLRRWSEQPCVRPLSAVHRTAGHNALRGSGPGQKHTFEDAVAHVDCPDRRIDRRCITSQPLRHTGTSRSRLRRERRVHCSVRSLPSSPGHPDEFVGERNGCDLGGAPGQQSSEPGPMIGAMNLSIADHGERPSREQAAQIAIALFADTAKLVLAPARVLLRWDQQSWRPERLPAPAGRRGLRPAVCSSHLIDARR